MGRGQPEGAPEAADEYAGGGLRGYSRREGHRGDPAQASVPTPLLDRYHQRRE